MSGRFVTNALIALLGGFVVVASQTFGATTVGWIGFAFGAAVVVIALIAQLDRGRGILERAVDVSLGALGGLAMAFGLAASGSAVVWTIFAFALGWVGLSYVGLALHEMATWRVRHGLPRLPGLPREEPDSLVHDTSERIAA